MGKRIDELYAKIAQTGGKPAEWIKIPRELFQAALDEEQEEREARDDAYYAEFDKIIEQQPIMNPEMILRHRARHLLDEKPPTDPPPPAKPEE